MKRIGRAFVAVIIMGGLGFLVQLIWDYSTKYGFTLSPLLQNTLAVQEFVGAAAKTALCTATGAVFGVLIQWRKAD